MDLPPATLPVADPIIPDAVQLFVSAAGAALVEQRKESAGWKEINDAEQQMALLPQIEMPLRNFFTPIPQVPGMFLYTREITMPAGTLLPSRIHLFEHPFVITKGLVSVWDDVQGWQHLRAPYLAVTTPATRRVLYIHEETTWITSHHTTHTDPDRAVDELTYPHLELGHMNNLTAEQLTAIESNAKPAHRAELK